MRGNGSANRGAGEPTNRPLLEAGGTTPAPCPAGAPDVEGWGDWSLARP